MGWVIFWRQETLGFTPKVDFNAGVVAAGEAQIESTVTGNEPGTVIPDPQKALKDQSQARRRDEERKRERGQCCCMGIGQTYFKKNTGNWTIGV